MRATAVILVSALLAPGQSPPAPESSRQGAVFSVTSTLIQLDAVVTDSKGRHIADLTADDFEILEDGKPQKITHFSYVQVTPETTPVKTKTRVSIADLPPPPLAKLRAEDVRRTIVLMVDDLGLSFESMAAVRSSLRKFVNDQIQPGDLVAICRTGAGSGALQQFSIDKRVLLSVIDGLNWNPNGRYGTGYFDPYGKLSPLAEALSGTGHGSPTRNGDAESLDVSYTVAHDASSTVGTLGAINYVIGALRDLPGRKSIVLFSDGFKLIDSDGLSLYDDALRALHKLVDRANRSGTVIYTMHASGLQTMVPDAQDRPTLYDRDGPQLGQFASKDVIRGLNDITQVGQGRDVMNNTWQQNLMQLAESTGGLAYYNGNDLNWALNRVLEDQRGYYLIGYHPPETTLTEKNRARDFHRVQVKVKRAGLHVRSRSGFFGQTNDETLPKFTTPVEQLRASMLSPFQSSDVGVRLTALYAEVPKRGPVVRNLLRVNAADLSWEKEADGGEKARVLIVALANGAGDQPLAQVGRVFDLRAAPGKMEEVLRDGALYSLDVPVPKRGGYQIRVAVRDQATSKYGSASQFIEIPKLKKSGFALASIILQDGERSASPGELGITPAARQFKSGTSFEFLCMVENGGKKAPDPDLTSRIRILRDGKEIYSAPGQFIAIKSSGRAVFGALKLGNEMRPGDYFLQVVAATPKGGKGAVASQWTDFTVLP